MDFVDPEVIVVCLGVVMGFGLLGKTIEKTLDKVSHVVIYA